MPLSARRALSDIGPLKREPVAEERKRVRSAARARKVVSSYRVPGARQYFSPSPYPYRVFLRADADGGAPPRRACASKRTSAQHTETHTLTQGNLMSSPALLDSARVRTRRRSGPQRLDIDVDVDMEMWPSPALVCAPFFGEQVANCTPNERAHSSDPRRARRPSRPSRPSRVPPLPPTHSPSVSSPRKCRLPCAPISSPLHSSSLPCLPRPLRERSQTRRDASRRDATPTLPSRPSRFVLIPFTLSIDACLAIFHIFSTLLVLPIRVFLTSIEAPFVQSQ